jgi:murein hydrolase activator
MILRHVFLAVLFFGMSPQVGFAATSDARNKLQTVEQQLSQRKAAEAALAEKTQKTSEDLEELRHKLITATEALEVKEAEQGHLQDKLDDLADDFEAKNAALAGERQKFGMLTEALVELSRQPPESFFLRTGLTADHIHQVILLRSMLPRIREQTDVIAHDLGALDELKNKLAEQKRLTAAAQKNLTSQRQNLDQLIRVRQGYLQRTEEQKEAISKQLVSLANEAKDLHQLLEKVTPKHGKPGSVRGFSSSLKPPVVGHVVRRFGERDTDGVTSDGITFTALPGAPVVAPAPGRVVFAGPFRGYGQIVILQHDGGYHSFLAGFGRIDAEMDEDIEAGEPLGVLPVTGNAHPELYFEWRRNSEPVDPAKFSRGAK